MAITAPMGSEVMVAVATSVAWQKWRLLGSDRSGDDHKIFHTKACKIVEKSPSFHEVVSFHNYIDTRLATTLLATTANNMDEHSIHYTIFFPRRENS